MALQPPANFRKVQMRPMALLPLAGALALTGQAPALSIGGGVASGTLEWDAAAGATSYIIKWGTTSGSYSEDQNVGNVLTYDFADLSPQMTADVTYYMTVKAYDGVNEQDFWSEIVVLNGALIG